MKKQEKINYLKDKHFSEWIDKRRESEDELSDRQAMFCVCGQLATGLHERSCRRFQNKVDALTIEKLKDLLPKQKRKIQILKIYKEPNSVWHKESVEDCIRRTEGVGHWKEGTVLAELEKGNIVETPFAYYKKKGVKTTIEEELKS